MGEGSAESWFVGSTGMNLRSSNVKTARATKIGEINIKKLQPKNKIKKKNFIN